MNLLDDFTAVLLILIGVSLVLKHSNRCTTGPLTQKFGVLSVVSQRGMLNFLVRNIWTNNHILSEQFTLFLGQNNIFKKYFFLRAAPGSIPYMWCTTEPVTQ